MSAPRAQGGVRGRGPENTDFGEIQSLPDIPLEPKLRSQLKKEEEQASLPRTGPLPRATEPLDAVLGDALTIDNPVWSGDPVPRLRGLQKLLVEHSLTLAPEDRGDNMRAIAEVERTVQLRLRWLQMKRSDAEREETEQRGKANDENEKTKRVAAG